eukprot:TRINITY_DN5771_c4_g1_i1.p1 TRINITY_DN5771_c4_g1~~TRINITY_DN5771_c4_g1_i1.p1  ORF type:complete len:841 (+),score=151.68 TRINITY_DN5771_c4_g1_i1:40-2562(+)
MKGFVKTCLGQGESESERFVRKFTEQANGEVDDAWRANYADGELLLHCEQSRDDQGIELLPTTLEFCWAESFQRSSTAFTKQLDLLRDNWTMMRRTLDKYEDENIGIQSEQSRAMVHVLRRMTEDHYRELMKLQIFQYWHRNLFERAENLVPDVYENNIADKEWWAGKDGAIFRNRLILGVEMKLVTERYAQFRAHTNADMKGKQRGALSEMVTLEQADAMLSERRVHHPPPPGLICLFGVSSGVILTFVVVLCFLFTIDPVDSYDPDKHLYDIVPYFRGYIVIYVALWLWALVVYRMERRRINYPYFLNLSGKTIKALHIAQGAAMLTALCAACFTFYLAEVRAGLRLVPFFRSNPRYFILVNAVTPVAVLLCPFKVMQHSTRLWLCRVLLAILITPILPCTFEGNFITDYLTSLVKPILDLSLTMCSMLTGRMLRDPLVHTDNTCSRDGVLMPSLCALAPLSWRLLQCWRRGILEPLVLAKPRKPVVPQRLHGEEDLQSPESLLGEWKVHDTGTVFTLCKGELRGSVVFKFFDESGDLATTTDVNSDVETQMLNATFHCELRGLDRTEGRGKTSSRKISISHHKIEDDMVAEIEVTCVIESEEYCVTKLASRHNPSTARRPIVWPHCVNMGKYMFSIIPVVVGLFHSEWGKRSMHDWPVGRVIYVFLLLFSTCYSYLWDVFMDWGLWKQNTFPPRGLVECCGGLVWRNTSVDFRSKWFFLLVMMYNLLGRLAWTFTLVAEPSLLGLNTSDGNKEVLTLITSLIEVCRRSSWGLIRLGHEHDVDVGSCNGGSAIPLLMAHTPWTKPGQAALLHRFALHPTNANNNDETIHLSGLEGTIN